jgi:hypothetical protein
MVEHGQGRVHEKINKQISSTYKIQNCRNIEVTGSLSIMKPGRVSSINSSLRTRELLG